MEGSKEENQVKGTKGKSCKGCIYYSSTRKSKDRDPLCVGISRTLQQVPNFIVGESEVEASKEGRSLKDFKYACVGYSVYKNSNPKDASANPQEKRAELPTCIGIEVLMDRRPATAAHVPAHAHNKEDGQVFPQPQLHKPAHSTGDVREDFLGRFSRNASLVASGVAKNVCRVGNYIKANVDDILYPYGRRPK